MEKSLVKISTEVSQDFTKTIDRFQQLSIATKEGIWEYDFENKATFYNQGMISLLGYTITEMADNNTWWRNNIHPTDKKRIITELDNLLESTETVWWGKYQFKCKNNSYKLILDRLFVVRGKNGKPMRLIGTMQDLSDLETIQTNLEKIRQDERKVMIKELIKASEKERKGISEELHENFNQALAAINLHLGSIKKHISPNGLSEVVEMQKILIDSMSGIRNIANELSPVILHSLGLASALEEMIERKLPKKIAYNIEVNEAAISNIDVKIQLLLYRIAYQQIKNIAEHSNASNAFLQVTKLGSKIKMSISDDGDGVDLKALKFGNGFSSTQQRTEAFDGTFNIKTILGKQGFKLEVII
jgi:PAS domain S-box-containing protein